MNMPPPKPARPAPFIEELTAAPEKFLDLTITEMHSIPNGALQEIHARALSAHFAAMVERVPVLALLAEEQHIREISEIEEEYDPAETPLPSKSYAEFISLRTRSAQKQTEHESK